jgi:hypothetical protein
MRERERERERGRRRDEGANPVIQDAKLRCIYVCFRERLWLMAGRNKRREDGMLAASSLSSLTGLLELQSLGGNSLATRASPVALFTRVNALWYSSSVTFPVAE